MERGRGARGACRSHPQGDEAEKVATTDEQDETKSFVRFVDCGHGKGGKLGIVGIVAWGGPENITCQNRRHCEIRWMSSSRHVTHTPRDREEVQAAEGKCSNKPYYTPCLPGRASPQPPQARPGPSPGLTRKQWEAAAAARRRIGQRRPPAGPQTHHV
ncbi:unnamed protein product [Pleuronectes platessa]|uniref:Uncharacterized protein n=1 Tax=Pleuronectes platessa TaxID=8262 RepID=A0A9N7VYQ3_PLEPL|nr:unnamed protein product [Pleuronectes platessa]